jgi:membrane-associated phospholipid phosphatase
MPDATSDPLDRLIVFYGPGLGLLAWFTDTRPMYAVVPVANLLLAAMVPVLLRRLRAHTARAVRVIAVLLPLLVFYVYYEEAGIALASPGIHWRDAAIVAFEHGATAAIPTFDVPWLGPVLGLAYIAYVPFFLVGIVSVAAPADHFDPTGPAERTVRAMCVAWAICYVLYFLYPALGPKDLTPDLRAIRVGTGLLARFAILPFDHLMIHGDAFPSAHLAATTVVTAALWRWRRPFFWILLPVAVGIPLGAAYLGYHYLTDLAVGTAIGAVVFYARVIR